MATDINTQVRTLIAQELHVEHLSSQEQERIIEELGDALMTRAIAKILEFVPKPQHSKIEDMVAGERAEELQSFLESYVPDAGDIIEKEIRAGLDEYRHFLNEALVKNES